MKSYRGCKIKWEEKTTLGAGSPQDRQLLLGAEVTAASAGRLVLAQSEA